MKSEAFLKNLAKQYVNETGEIYKRENAAISPAPTPRMDGKMWAARRRQKWKTHRHIFMSIAASIVVLVVVGIAILPEILTTPRIANESVTDDAQFFGTGNVAGAPPAPATEATPPPPAMLAPPVADTPDEATAWRQVAVPDEDDLLNTDFALAEEADGGLLAEAAPAMPPGIAQISLTPPPGWHIVYTDFDGDMTIFHLEGAAQNRVVVIATTPPPEANDFSQFFPVLINDTWAHMRIESTHSVLIYQLDGVQFTLTTAYDYQDLITLAHSWV